MRKLFLLSLLAAGVAAAQPPPDDPDAAPAAPRDWAEPGMPPPPSGGPGEKPHIQRFLDMLRQQNPTEFDRMKKLRAEDPEAFRQELHARLQRERERRGIDGAPGNGQMMRGMAGDMRDRMARAMKDGGPGPDGMNVRSPEIDRLEQKSRDLAQAYRKAADDAEKTRLQGELKAALSEAFDLRESIRRERFAQMEARVKKVREMMDQRQAQRDAIIERRLQELTEGEKLAW